MSFTTNAKHYHSMSISSCPSALYHFHLPFGLNNNPVMEIMSDVVSQCVGVTKLFQLINPNCIFSDQSFFLPFSFFTFFLKNVDYIELFLSLQNISLLLSLATVNTIARVIDDCERWNLQLKRWCWNKWENWTTGWIKLTGKSVSISYSSLIWCETENIERWWQTRCIQS